MEVDEIQTSSGCKYPRISNGNGRVESKQIVVKGDDEYLKRSSSGLCGWPSSRIVRVSRASGGKDRHSKVWTSKGLRDRRVRLSVNTAIQFYDLQDRLGYDQPSKAVEWLLKAAATSISELPSLNAFPDSQQISEDKRSSAGTEQALDSAEVEIDDEDLNYQQQQQQQQQQQHGSLSKSACSSTSETSKGSGLSLSRSESRVKARERARERAAEKEKDKENESSRGGHHHHTMHSSSFTELLTGGMNNNNNNPGHADNGRGTETNFFNKSPFEYFPSGLLGHRGGADNTTTSGFHVGNPLFSMTGEHHHNHHQELQHFPFVSDHLVPVVSGGNNVQCSNNNDNNNSNEYNLNFSISSSSSSGLAGYNRGTLQSNSSSLLPRYAPIEGSQSFFNGTVDNHHHFLSPYDSRLHLFYGHSDHKGKGKN